jgi:arylformamidase
MSRWIDLTLTLESGMRGVEFEPKHTLSEHGWNSRTLHLYSHCGTHMDAPHHFGASDQTIDRIPLEACCGPAWVVDIPDAQSRALIEVDHLGTIDQDVRPGDGLLLRTGWSRYRDDPDVFRNELPRVSQGLADWCVERSVRILGVEPPSVADVNNLQEVTAIHRTLLGGNVVIVEGLVNLELLRQARVYFVALPLKIAGGDGSPCRAFALDDPEAGFS